jgi:hypothetical protein
MDLNILAALGLENPDQLAKMMAARGVQPPAAPAQAPMPMQKPVIPDGQVQGPIYAPGTHPSGSERSPGDEAFDTKELMAALGSIQAPPGQQQTMPPPAAQAPRAMDPMFGDILDKLMRQRGSAQAPQSNLAAMLGGM